MKPKRAKAEQWWALVDDKTGQILQVHYNPRAVPYEAQIGEHFEPVMIRPMPKKVKR